MEPKPGEDTERTNRVRAVFRAYPAVNDELRLPEFLADIIYFCRIRGFDFEGSLSEAREMLEKE
jgi:hypothetical protein